MTGNVRQRSASNVFSQESDPRRAQDLTGGYEELGPIGVLSSVSHGEEARLAVLQLEVFVWIVDNQIQICQF